MKIARNILPCQVCLWQYHHFKTPVFLEKTRVCWALLPSSRKLKASGKIVAIHWKYSSARNWLCDDHSVLSLDMDVLFGE